MTTLAELERHLWNAADELRANSRLKSSEYSVPVLGLIFLRYADVKFQAARQRLEPTTPDGSAPRRRRAVGKEDYQAEGVLYLPETARFSALLDLPEGRDLGQAVTDAMKAIEEENPDLKGVLPKTYNRLDTRTLVDILKTFASVSVEAEGDTFGRIYEYFLGNFAMTEGQKGGEFYTPTSIVKLIVDILEPFKGRVYDPACGSGGMFVQSARFVAEHQNGKHPDTSVSPTGDGTEVPIPISSAQNVLRIHGQEKTRETMRLAKMNLAVHGLAGDIREGNTYYEDLHNSVGRFDFVMANPPFNVNRVDKERLKTDARFPFGLPRTDNANYLWIQHFYSALNPKGRAGFVMANSASDARSSEQDIRERLIRSGAVDVMVSVGSNFFYTVTLPCTLWFFDKGKPEERKDQVLFIDARSFYRQVTRAVREFTPEQGEFLSNIVRLYRGEVPETDHGGELINDHFPDGVYRDVPGVCKVATIGDIEAQGWSLNPGRYVGVAARAADDVNFLTRLQELNEELELLNARARELEEAISTNVTGFLEYRA